MKKDWFGYALGLSAAVTMALMAEVMWGLVLCNIAWLIDDFLCKSDRTVIAVHSSSLLILLAIWNAMF